MLITSYVILFTCPALGQVQQKRVLTEQDYKLWHEVQMDKLSPDGVWVSYRLIYDQVDTLFVKNTKTNSVIGFSGGTKSSFSKDYFSCISAEKKLCIVRLKNSKLMTIDHVDSYDMLANHLVYYDKKRDSGSLSICNLDGTVEKVITGVQEYIINPTKDEIAVSIQNEHSFEIFIFKFGDIPTAVSVHKNEVTSYQKLTWSKTGNNLAFFAVKGAEGAVFYYNRTTQKLSELDCKSKDCFSEERTIQKEQKITFSEDNESVFFTVQQSKVFNEDDESAVQVWNTADKQIYPGAKVINGWTNSAVQVMWTPRNDQLLEINHYMLPFGGAVGNKEVAVTFNPQRYEPQGAVFASTDLYLNHLKTGKKSLLLEDFSTNDYYSMSSPLGKYITYFKQGKWFVYDIEKDKHIDVTKGIKVSFADLESDRIGPVGFFRAPDWLVGDESLLLYDKYDVWQVFPNGKSPLRLTFGREKGITFRVVPQNSTERSFTMSRVRTSGQFDLNKTVLLSATAPDYLHSGYFTYSNKEGLQKITYQNKKTRSAVQNQERTVTAWIGESFENSPEIYLSHKGRVQSVFKSNVHQSQFLWGTCEVVNYETVHGQALKGILYYPADFEVGKKYPMIVSIYEQQLSGIHHYWVPRIENGTGINYVNLTSQGYFVFRPDIVYSGNDVGQAALECVESAVKKVLSMGNVEATRIGLTGHSFGGYETNYIISKSTLFACAVAGAAVSDLVSANHAVHLSAKTPNFFIIENGQYRIGGSIADKKAYYINNSPIYSAGGINTPLLSWAGLEDTQVDARQSIELYMALRRLGKNHIMLLYPDEIHELMNRKNTEDLTRKVEAWFGHYLKGNPLENWMIPD